MPSTLPDILTNLGTQSRRLVHGRGGRFPGLEHLSIDWFAPTILVTRYAELHDDKRTLTELQSVAEKSPDIKAIVLQDRHQPNAPKKLIHGQLPAQPIAHESGLSYHLNLTSNQNHGFFLDMKPGRDWIHTSAKGKRILNLFAYTCSLSVAAIAGGATSVINLDMASGALSTGRKNHQLNFDKETSRRATYLAHDLFKSWGKLKRLAPFDTIIIDPPSNQAGSFVAEKDYPRMARRLAELTKPQGQLLACLNAPHLSVEFLLETFPDHDLVERLAPTRGFEDNTPQSTLKACIFTNRKAL